MRPRFDLPEPHFLAVGMRAVPSSELGRDLGRHFCCMGPRFGIPEPLFLAVGMRAVPYSELGCDLGRHLCSMGLRFGFPWSHFLAVGVRAVLFSELGRNFVADIARSGAHGGSPERLLRPSDLKALSLSFLLLLLLFHQMRSSAMSRCDRCPSVVARPKTGPPEMEAADTMR